MQAQTLGRIEEMGMSDKQLETLLISIWEAIEGVNNAEEIKRKYRNIVSPFIPRISNEQETNKS